MERLVVITVYTRPKNTYLSKSTLGFVYRLAQAKFNSLAPLGALRLRSRRLVHLVREVM
jgi:hypothetical protein